MSNNAIKKVFIFYITVFLLGIGFSSLAIAASVQIINPLQDDVISGTIIISGTADGNVQIVWVEIYDYWYNASGTTSWSYVWNTTTVPNSWYVILAESYDASGNYLGQDDVLVNVYNPPPVASFTFEPANPKKTDLIYFNSTSYARIYDATIVNWTWDFDDGSYAYTNKTTHIYSTAGSYNVSLNVTDSYGFTNSIIKQVNVSLNHAPVINFINPQNTSVNVDIVADLNWTCSDIDGNSLTYDVYFGTTNPPPLVVSGQSATVYDPGIMNYETMYNWSLSVTDGLNWINNSYYFTTRGIYNLNPPSAFEAENYNKTQISLMWSKAQNATHTYIERNTTSSWSKGEGIQIYNNTGTSFNDGNLIYNTTYYYQAWSWNNIDNVWSSGSVLSSNTTSNGLPILRNETPSDGSTNKPINVTLSVTVFDADNDLMNITFYTNSTGQWSLIGYNASSPNGVYYQKNTHFNNYSTKYWWSVNCTDGYRWTNETYHFTTKKNQAPSLSGVTPSNNSKGVSISTSSLKVNIVDPEGDKFNWTIKTSPNIGSSSGNNASSGIKSCSISGLSYNTTYNWYVSVIDRVNGSWVNATYRFKTVGYQAILLSGVTPSNGSTGVPISTSSLGVNIIDTKGAKFNWTIKTSPNIGSSHGNKDINGSKSCSISGLAYSTTYYWYVNASDGNLSTHAFYYFVTQSEPSPPPGSPPGAPPTSPPQYMAPSADANGPYYTFLINGIAKVTFDGSGSSGSITSYSWDFGDGKTGTGVSPTHVYTALGNYTVKITVTGNNGTDTDKTYAVISEVPNIPPTQPVVSGPQKGSKNIDYDYTAVSTDGDNDSIQYIFNWDDGSNSTTNFVANGTAVTVSHNWSTWGIYLISVKAYDNKTLSDTKIYPVSIDIIYIKDMGYLIDNDSDGTYEIFYSIRTNEKTPVEKLENGTYLIKNEQGSGWGYIYDPGTNTLFEYSQAKGTLKTDNNTIWYMLLAGITMIVVAIAVIIVYLKKNYYI